MRASLPLDFRGTVEKALDDILVEQEVIEALRPAGGLSPMVLSVGGGMRLDAAGVISGLFTSAAVQIYCLRLRHDEPTFVRTVLDNFEELRRAVRGEKVRALAVAGIAGVALPEGVEAKTPWGILRPAPETPRDLSFLFRRPKTTCILTDVRLVTVKLDSAPQPQHEFDQSEMSSPKAGLLLSLACALASSDTSNPAGPIVTWRTLVLPFQSGLGYWHAGAPFALRQPASLESAVSDLEEWGRRIDSHHASSLDVAATRVVSAIAHRHDRADALIDAVMAWENLLGTETEVTFRVSASLSKLLEADIGKRIEMKNRLSKIYGIRSRIVHGAVADPSDIIEAARTAVDVAIRALRVFYSHRTDLISRKSMERADLLLLGDE